MQCRIMKLVVAAVLTIAVAALPHHRRSVNHESAMDHFLYRSYLGK